MHRTDADSNVANLFADADPGVPTAGTLIDDDWLNAVQEEIANTVEMDGTALVKGTNTQLRTLMAPLLAAVTPGGRLTINTGGEPMDSSDQVAAGAVIYAPYIHKCVPIYNGTRWILKTISVYVYQDLTDNLKSPAAAANNQNYDMFLWMDSSTLRLSRGPTWTSDTVRGTGAGTTELERFEGRWVNKVAITNACAARRGLYVGTIRTDGSASANDTQAKRHVWNAYNRVRRDMKVVEATASWNYTTATWRQARASSANQLDFVVGLSEDTVEASASALVSNTNVNVPVSTGIGLDSTTTPSGVFVGADTPVAGYRIAPSATYKGAPSVGRHYLAWLEFSGATGTSTWIGVNGTTFQTGITGTILA